MAISTRQVKNKRDSNGVLTGRPGTVYDVNIKYTAPDGKLLLLLHRGNRLSLPISMTGWKAMQE